MAMVNLPLQFKVALALFIFVTYIILPGGAVKRETFKTCEQSGFCKRNRDLADKTSVLGKSWSCPYELQPDSLTFEDGILSGTLRKIDSSGEYIRFPITISFYTSGEARIVIDEERRMRGLIELRHGSKANKKRYDEAWKWATVGSLELSKSSTFDASQPRMGFSQVEYGPNNMFRAILHHSPFEVEIQKGDQTHIHLNSRGLLNLEHWRPKESGRSSSEDDTTWWEETFDRHTDSKPRGPESVAMDINFPGYGHVFGIPEHADVHSTLGLSVSRQCFPFAGADVGGFFDDPDSRLLTRWYQAGIWYPFFRAHSHIDTKRREPYLINEFYRTIIVRAIHLRYQLLPAWYTSFHEASVNGMPIIRPQYYIFPDDEEGFAIDDQIWLGGTGILVKPVVTDTDSTDIYFAGEEKFYDYFDFTTYQPGRIYNIHTPLEKIPMFIQGGHIIPRRDRPRRSSALMRWDPFTLVVTLNKDGIAQGSLYIDDSETFDYQEGAYIHRQLLFHDSILSSVDISHMGPRTDEFLKEMKNLTVERVVVVDPPPEWRDKKSTQVHEKDSGDVYDVAVTYHEMSDGRSDYVVVKKPNMNIGSTWEIKF